VSSLSLEHRTICEGVFTRTESGKHAILICYPAICETRP